MARTKKQAIAGQAGSAQTKTTVNDGGGPRVGALNGRTVGSRDVSAASSSERQRRAEPGDDEAEGAARRETDEQGEDERQSTRERGRLSENEAGEDDGNGGDKRRISEKDDSFFTARETIPHLRHRAGLWSMKPLPGGSHIVSLPHLNPCTMC